MLNPKTIKIFLIDGEPTGSKFVELSNWTGKAYIIPRNRIKVILLDKESKQDLESQSIYFLIGTTDSNEEIIYVGEAENFLKRLLQHNQNKEFWNLAISFFAKDKNLTKSHIKYLETRITQNIKEADRVLLENATYPAITHLPRADKAEMEEYLQNIEIILASLGYTFSQKAEKTSTEGVFICKSMKSYAQGVLTDEGFVVL
ncbi:MAG: GIY-YIG nuclease family protein [Candidatus Levyibacteriota bacterium]